MSTGIFMQESCHRDIHFLYTLKVIIQQNVAVGVELLWRGKMHNISSLNEVILSAGAIDSPKILMLSGVGPKQHLQQLGVYTQFN